MPRIARFAVFALAALLFFGLPSALTLYTDWLWFGETGYRQIFATSLGTRLMLGAVTFLATFGWLLLNLRVALSSLRFAGPDRLDRAAGSADRAAEQTATGAARDWRGRHCGASRSPVRRERLAHVPQLASRPAVRVRGPGARVRRVVLPLHAPVHRVRARRADGARGAGGAGRGRRICRLRRGRPVATGGVLVTRTAQRHLALLAAAFLLLLGGGRLARHSALVDDPCGDRPRRVVYGRGGALPCSTRARRGVAPGRCAGGRRSVCDG